MESIKKLLLISTLLINLSFINAQESGLKKSSFQVTFITPIGTNGVNSSEYVNEFSFNILAGYNGGLNGFEVGGMVNMLKEDGDGVQGSGFANIVMGSFDGLQVAGFANLNNKASEGFQASGFGNVCAGSYNGFQASGFGNIAGKGSDVLQISGFGNIADGRVKGLQAGGFINVADKMDGAQLAGFINIADEFDGIQASGFLNIADKGKGFQIGVINICDSIDGIPIGFLSIVDNGYKSFEFWGSDALHVNMAYKLGVKKFYNIFTIGTHFTSGFKWAYGYGIGSQFNISEESILNLEAISYDIREQLKFNYYVSLNQLRINYGMEYQEGKSYFVGPTFNVLVSQGTNARQISNQIAPYYFFNHTGRNQTNVKMWIGINAGVRF